MSEVSGVSDSNESDGLFVVPEAAAIRNGSQIIKFDAGQLISDPGQIYLLQQQAGVECLTPAEYKGKIVEGEPQQEVAPPVPTGKPAVEKVREQASEAVKNAAVKAEVAAASAGSGKIEKKK